MSAKILLACVVASMSAAMSVRAAEIGDPAAPIEISDWLKGDAFTLDDVKGKKIVVVEFWATWCGPCVKSIPHISEMQEKFADRGVVFLGVTDEDAATAQPFVDKMAEKMNYVVACDKNGATNKSYLGAYGVKGIPHAFIIDRDGKIAWHGHPMSGLDKELEKLAAVAVKEDPIAVPFAPAGFKFSDYRGNFNLQRVFQEYYRAVTSAKSDETKIKELADRLELVQSSDIDAQNEIAWTLLTDKSIKTRNLKLALKFSKAAFTLSAGKNADVLETYSRALFDNGNAAEAAKILQQAIHLVTDPARQAELKETLKTYQPTK